VPRRSSWKFCAVGSPHGRGDDQAVWRTEPRCVCNPHGQTRRAAGAGVLHEVEQRVPPTPFEQEDYPNRPGVRRYPKHVRFASISPVKAGWLVKNKGQWSLTNEGRTAYAQFTDPEAFQREADRLYYVWKKGQPEPEPSEEEAPGDVASASFEEAEEARRVRRGVPARGGSSLLRLGC